MLIGFLSKMNFINLLKLIPLMRKLILALFVLFLVFGCIEQKTTSSNPSETVLSQTQLDLDSDGFWDYSKIDFSPQRRSDIGLEIKRTLIITPKKSFVYRNYNSSINDLDRLTIDSSLDNFESDFSSIYLNCANNMGVLGVTCTDPQTCFNLCTSSNSNCRKISSSDGLFAGNLIRSFSLNQREITKPVSNLRSDIYEVNSLQSANSLLSEYTSFASKVSQSIKNPALSIYSLCDVSAFDYSFLNQILSKIGSIESQTDSYEYQVVLSISNPSNSQIQSFDLTDSLAQDAIIPDSLSSPMSFDIVSPNKVHLNQTSKLDSSFTLAYSFDSQLPPEQLIPSLNSPTIKTSVASLESLSIFQGPYSYVQKITSNSSISISLSFSLVVIGLLFIFNFSSLLFHFVSEKPSSMRFANSIRRAFGKVSVNWKTQLVLSVLSIVGAYGISVMLVPSDLLFSANLISVISNLLKSELLLVSILIGIFGFSQFYFALENLFKLMLLEKAYGIAISQEKDLYIAQASNLVDKISSLSKLVDSASSSGIDATSESDVLSRISGTKVSEMASVFNPKNKALVSEWGEKVDDAISSVSSKISGADQNWSRWESYISSMISSQPQLTVPMLVSIPPALRIFAVSKYVRLHSNEVSFENGVISRKKLSYDGIVLEMVRNNYLKGGILLKDEKPIVNFFSSDGGTVNSVLSLKIRSSALAFSKSLLNRDVSSFVIVCDNLAIAYLKNLGLDAILFMDKEKYKDTLDMWKIKTKMVEN